MAKEMKSKIEDAKEASEVHPEYWELSRGDLINETKRREIEVKGLNKKGSYISKEQLIQYLENDDASK